MLQRDDEIIKFKCRPPHFNMNNFTSSKSLGAIPNSILFFRYITNFHDRKDLSELSQLFRAARFQFTQVIFRNIDDYRLL